jgi:predicted outer membrane repeat protein
MAPPDSSYGGGICIYTVSGQVDITDCIIRNNTSYYEGAGIYLYWTDASITNCLITGNKTTGEGGGIYTDSNLDISLSTIADNSANYGGGFYCDSFTSNATMSNSVVWGNSAVSDGNQIYYGSSTVLLFSSDYANATSDVSGTGTFTPDGGCISLDPLFVVGPKGAYYLSQTLAGQLVNSPCLDAGSDTAANFGMDTKTTRTDEVTDAGDVDIGYHYEP